jgi:hypothetical protein
MGSLGFVLIVSVYKKIKRMRGVFYALLTLSLLNFQYPIVEKFWKKAVTTKKKECVILIHIAFFAE